jgi:hypothetical protein
MDSTPDHLSQDPREPPARPRKPRFRLPADPEEDEPAPTSTLDPDRDLPGCIFMVPNEQWDIESATSTDHPGACVHYQEASHSAILVKGTDVENLRDLRGYRIVVPAANNGLSRPTAFELVPRYFRLHKIRVLYPERHLGTLDEATLFALCEELARACAEE